jgi:barstar (barnase inhibitor)
MKEMTKSLWPTTCVNSDCLSEIRDALSAMGFRVFELDGGKISDLSSFFQEIIHVLPNNPPLSGRPNLDAFLDSVWEGMDELGEDNVALLWTNADNMLGGSLQGLFVVSDCLQEIARSLRTSPSRNAKGFSLQVFLFGSGSDFPTIHLIWTGNQFLRDA